MAAPDPQLTIVLTLKDRTPFTYRWMRYMNDLKCRYPIFIADGGEDHEVEAHLREADRYPNLHYTYIRYPFDQDDAVYYRKLSDVVDRVSTPYILLADNDDFFVLEAIPSFVQFLNDHDDFASCGGEPVSLFLLAADDSVVAGPTARGYRAIVDDASKSVTDDGAADRVCHLLTNIDRCRLWMSWYQVHRTSAVKHATRIIRDHQFADPVSFEIHVLMCLLMAGKSQHFRTHSYVRQEGSSQFTSAIGLRGNLVERFLWSNAFGDFHRTLRSFASELSDADQQRIQKTLTRWFSGKVISLYSKQFVDHSRTAAADPVEKLYRLTRRVLRPLVSPFRRARASVPTVSLPALEEYILDSPR